jgi:hypothetical protein
MPPRTNSPTRFAPRAPRHTKRARHEGPRRRTGPTSTLPSASTARRARRRERRPHGQPRDSAELERLRAEHRELLASWEYAFAMGHGCTIGDHPRLTAVRERAAHLQAPDPGADAMNVQRAPRKTAPTTRRSTSARCANPSAITRPVPSRPRAEHGTGRAANATPTRSHQDHRQRPTGEPQSARSPATTTRPTSRPTARRHHQRGRARRRRRRTQRAPAQALRLRRPDRAALRAAVAMTARIRRTPTGTPRRRQPSSEPRDARVSGKARPVRYLVNVGLTDARTGRVRPAAGAAG